MITIQEKRSLLSSAQLIDALDTLGIPFLRGGSGVTTPIEPAELVAALARSPEARLRLALIPLLLAHPEFSWSVVAALAQAAPDAAITLRCYYTAAYWLQQKYWRRLTAALGVTPRLPDLFRAELGMSTYADPDVALDALAARQQVLSGRVLNWFGTYEHAVQSWLHQLEQRILWNQSQLNKSKLS